MFAVITGASKGIGRCMARELASRKYNLILTARSAAQLDELKNELVNEFAIQCEIFPCDLSSHDAPDKLFNFCTSISKDITVLINNAGYGLWGGFTDLTIEEQLNMADLNNRSLVHLCHLFLPILRKQHKSYILNVASTASYQPVPYLGLYSATKAFVIMFSRALRVELKNTSVSVTVLSPGATDTFFMDRAGMTSESLRKNSKKFGMTPEEVATFGINAMLTGKNEVIPGFINKVGAVAARLVPKSILENAAASLYKP